MDLTGLNFNSSSSYTILGEVGRGGMGIVYLAEKDSQGVSDHVALKIIRAKSDQHEARLKEEANIATGLRHENIVKTYGLESIPYSHLPQDFLRVFDTLSYENAHRADSPKVAPGGKLADALKRIRMAQQGVADEQKLILMVMDYVQGTDLRTLHQEHIKRKLLLPVPLAAFIISRIARALSYAHTFIVHRDVSPENILLNAQGVVKLSDFGLAVSEAAAGIQGKIAYMSPEQAGGQPVDARTDIYSLGLVLYVLLTGIMLQKVPAGATAQDRLRYLRGIIGKQILPPDKVRTDVPPEVSRICMKMLAQDRDQRTARAEDVARDLEQRYLYAHGFGPTNNSLQAYTEIFDAEFKDPTPQQLQQLPFLQGKLQRAYSAYFYTPEGIKLLEETATR